jgi:ubiquinone/menaquinone biosynthesis C-methylase UbiE
LDIGCGMGETTRQLAGKLDNGVELIGVDLDPNLIEVARSVPGTAEGKITFQQGDAAHLSFEDQTFDFVFARYLLHHLDQPQVVLAEMLRVCKSGGIVAVQEPDCAKQYCYPESWAYEKIPEIYNRVFANAFIGRQLYALFQQLGYPSPHIEVMTIAGVNVELRRSYRMVIEAIGPVLIEKGILDAQELQELGEELRRVEEQDDVLCVWSPTFSVWVNRT